MKVLLIKDENGQYVNKQQERFNMICCEWAKGPRANDFKEFATLQAALAYYSLTEYHTDDKESDVEEYHEPVIEGAIDVPAEVMEEEQGEVKDEEL